ncbi:hypothetical protein OA083_02790 [Candidatus Marinimicrobia bacterium]|nr:hypothetical protein [Candidatus Neomarinimicrobiota bacterium]
MKFLADLIVGFFTWRGRVEMQANIDANPELKEIQNSLIKNTEKLKRGLPPLKKTNLELYKILVSDEKEFYEDNNPYYHEFNKQWARKNQKERQEFLTEWRKKYPMR